MLREQAVGESDRLITVLTRSDGVLRAFARGAHQLKNKSASATQTLTYSDFAIFRGRDANTVDSADTRKVFFGLRQDLNKLTLAQYFCELAMTVGPEGDSGEDMLRLMLNGLHFLEAGTRPGRIIKAAVEMRMMALAGYMPDLVACRECRQYERPAMFFSVTGGTLVCGDCKRATESAAPVSPGVLAALRHTIYAPFPRLFSFELSDDGARALERLSESYVTAQLGRGFKTLDFYHRMAD